MATNEERAERAARVLEAYRTDPTCGDAYGGEPDSEVLTDLLTDLRHWAYRNGGAQTFSAASLSSSMHYTEERREARGT